MPQLQQQGLHLLTSKGVERAKRFIQQQQLRIGRQRPRNADALPLSAGKLPDKAFARVLQPDFLQHLQGNTLTLWFIHPRQLQTKSHVVLHVTPGQQTFILEYDPAICPRTVNPVTRQRDAAMLIRHKSGNQI